MSWFKSSAPSTQKLPPPTPLQTQRLKQIKSLQNSNQNVTEVQLDVEYKVAFSTGGQTLSLIIKLPPSFPNEKPIVHVSPPVKHPLVNETMKVVGSYPLNSFYMHSDLGKIIQQLIKEFKKQPPSFIGTTSPNSAKDKSSQETDYQPFTLQDGAPAKLLTETPVGHGNERLPLSDVQDRGLKKVYSASSLSDHDEIKNILKTFKDLSLAELESLLQDDDKFIDCARNLEEMNQFKNERAFLLEEVEKVAKSNLLMEPEIEDAQLQLKVTFEEYSELMNDFEASDVKQEELRNFYNIGTIITNLRIEAMKADEESEMVAEEFLQGNMKADAFVTDFMNKRMLGHMRRGKLEQLKDSIIY